MKRKTKIRLGVATLAIGLIALTGCTSSFCTTSDLAHAAVVFDNGVTKYYNTQAEAISDGAKAEEVYELTTIDGISGVYFTYSYAHNNGGITKTNDKAKAQSIIYNATNCEYWASLDLVILEKSYEEAKKAGETRPITTAEGVNNLLKKYAYLRFDSNNTQTNRFWDNWTIYDDLARTNMVTKYNVYGITYDIDKLPSTDYLSLYKSSISSIINAYRGCITLNDGEYGSYGWDGGQKSTVVVEGKTYSYAWSRGFFEGLLVYPIAALIDVTCNAFKGLGTGLNGTNGWAQLLTILLVTLIVRAFMFAVSFKSTINNAKMTELQPQIAKIQAKYPNANTSQNEKARMADEMNKLYKKNKINPFSSLLIMIVQFPLFICVWGAFTGSSWLATGGFLGLNFADSIGTTLFTGANWVSGSAWTALILFLLMAGSQVVSMLLPQWMQKKRQKNVTKLGNNPAQKQQGRTMKMVTYAMMIMIIFMGFTLASAMGVYWFVGALISIAQTLITQRIIDHQAQKKEKRK